MRLAGVSQASALATLYVGPRVATIVVKVKAEDVTRRSGVATAAQHRRAGRMRHRADRRPKDKRRERLERE
jgi:hypothetical protein